MKKNIFTGFGFGPIQAGLFAAEAFTSNNFERIVIAEIDQSLVDAVRANGGKYHVNVARSDCIEQTTIEGIEIYNPTVPDDRSILLETLSDCSEIATCLPSVDFYDAGDNSVAGLLARAFANRPDLERIVYTAENNNHAAEALEETIGRKNGDPLQNAELLNTVIGKMSQTTSADRIIAGHPLKAMTPDNDRAFLVEEFNKILVSQCRFTRGIDVFLERKNLLPFEEAKLYGHNAIHCLLAYVGARKGYQKMSELRDDQAAMATARKAFLDESGAALIRKYGNTDEALFTPEGYREYAEDLLKRMTNPYLDDAIDRIGRDPLRKLGPSDRIFGTMRLALQHGIEPVNMARGAMAGIDYVLDMADELEVPDHLKFAEAKAMGKKEIVDFLKWLWQNDLPDQSTIAKIADVMEKTKSLFR